MNSPLDDCRSEKLLQMRANKRAEMKNYYTFSTLRHPSQRHETWSLITMTHEPQSGHKPTRWDVKITRLTAFKTRLLRGRWTSIESETYFDRLTMRSKAINHETLRRSSADLNPASRVWRYLAWNGKLNNQYHDLVVIEQCGFDHGDPSAIERWFGFNFDEVLSWNVFAMTWLTTSSTKVIKCIFPISIIMTTQFANKTLVMTQPTNNSQLEEIMQIAFSDARNLSLWFSLDYCNQAQSVRSPDVINFYVALPTSIYLWSLTAAKKHGTVANAIQFMERHAGKLFYLYFQSFCFADLVIQPAWCNLSRLVLEWVINPLPFRQIIWLRLYWISDDMMGGGGLIIHQRMRVSHVNTLRMMWLCNFSWFVIQIASRRGIINSRPRAWDGGGTS